MDSVFIDGKEYTLVKKTKPRKIRVCFELTMPNSASWNGKWSGASEGHFLFKEYSTKYFEENKERLIGSWYYHWDDGWTACVTSYAIDGAESKKLKKLNRGFCGYGWMVDSILLIGEILNPDALKEELLRRQQNG